MKGLLSLERYTGNGSILLVSGYTDKLREQSEPLENWSSQTWNSRHTISTKYKNFAPFTRQQRNIDC